MWDQFQINASTYFKELREDSDFMDITLSCEDNVQIEAHKIILASSSLFFKTMLNKNKHPHPLIYLKGARANNLVSLLDFMYEGEVQILQENLDSFLSLARELQVKGLETDDSTKDYTMEKPKVNTKVNETKKQIEIPQKQMKCQKLKEEPLDNSFQFGKVSYTGNYENKVTMITRVEDLDNKIDDLREKSGKGFKCKICGTIMDTKQHMGNHIEAKHIDGIRHPCTKCEDGKDFKTRRILGAHMSRHNNVDE